MISNRSSFFSRAARGVIRAAAGAAPLAIAAFALSASAQSLPPSPAPLLEQMSQEMASLHRHIEASLVRVHAPER